MEENEDASDKQPFTVLIAAGGTGGHFYPALTVAYSLRERGARPVFAVAGQHTAEHRELAEREQFETVGLQAIRLPAKRLGTPIFFARLIRSVLHSLSPVRHFRPDCILGMGSFASVPVGLAAPLTRTPLVLHEGNAIPGRANRFLSRFAQCLMYSMPTVDVSAIHCKASFSGMPVRRELVEAAEEGVDAPRSLYHAWGLDPDLATVLAFGGSQGARYINEQLPPAVKRLGGAVCSRFQLIHLTGAEDNTRLQQEYEAAGLKAHVTGKEERMEKCYRMADLVISRAGASTISELALYGIPALLIPLPNAMDDHQRANADALAHRGAGVWTPQENFTSERCAEYIQDWLDSPGEWQKLGHNIGKFAAPNAADAIAQTLTEAVS